MNTIKMSGERGYYKVQIFEENGNLRVRVNDHMPGTARALGFEICNQAVQSLQEAKIDAATAIAADNYPDRPVTNGDIQRIMADIKWEMPATGTAG